MVLAFSEQHADTGITKCWAESAHLNVRPEGLISGLIGMYYGDYCVCIIIINI